MLKKILIFMIITLITFVSVLNASAWFTSDNSDDNGRGRDLMLTSNYLFNAFTNVKLSGNGQTTKIYNYNSTEFKKTGDLTITINTNELNNYIADNKIKLEISVNILALKDIDVRFKIIETWVKTNVVQENPNLLSFVYSDNILKESNQEYGYHNQSLEKNDDALVEIPVVKEIVVSDSLPSNEELKITIMVSAIQKNRSNQWENRSEYTSKGITLTKQTNLKNISMAITDVSTGVNLSRLVFEIIGNNKKYLYIYRMNSNTDDLLLEAGTYEIRLYIVNYIDFNFDTNTNPTKFTLSLKNENNEWGYEDFIYAPNLIRVWDSESTYTKSEIVYYKSSDPSKNGYYILFKSDSEKSDPTFATWNWRKVDTNEQKNLGYVKGEIIYYQGAFWIAKVESIESLPNNNGSWEWGWDRLGLKFAQGGTNYKTGSISYKEEKGVITWYYATDFSSSFANIAADTAWKQFGMNYSDVFRGSKKVVGEIVYYDSENINTKGYYIVTNNNWGAPTDSGVFRKITNPVNYTNKGYLRGDSVLYNINNVETRFVWTGADNTNYTGGVYKLPGVVGSGWQELTDEWRPHNTYYSDVKRRSSVVWEGKMYYWNGTNASNSVEAPGVERNGWQELTEYWTPYNYYNVGDFVLHDGSFWEVISNPYNETTKQNIIPRGMGSNSVWKEYEVIWNPGRS